jgi:hypothetical protein
MTSVWISPEIAPAAGGWLAIRGQTEAAEPAKQFLLRRSGGRPARFSGMLMLEHAAAASQGERRHVIRLYETLSGTIVIEVVLEAGGDVGLPHSVAAEVDSLEEAEAFLTDYDPASEASVSTGPLAAQALRLEAEAARLRTDFDACRRAVFTAFSAPDNDAGPTTRTN